MWVDTPICILMGGVDKSEGSSKKKSCTCLCLPVVFVSLDFTQEQLGKNVFHINFLETKPPITIRDYRLTIIFVSIGDTRFDTEKVLAV
jgi:hypothetical protein